MYAGSVSTCMVNNVNNQSTGVNSFAARPSIRQCLTIFPPGEPILKHVGEIEPLRYFPIYRFYLYTLIS